MRRLIFLILGVIGLSVIFSGSSHAQTGRKSVSAKEVTGTFEMRFSGKFRDQSNAIKIASLGNGKIWVDMDLMYPYILGGGGRSAHLGELKAEFVIKGDTATYSGGQDNRCRMTIKFLRAGMIRVIQTGSDTDCEFGHNVVATGTYRKTSSKRPTVTEP